MTLRDIWQFVKGKKLQRCPACNELIESDAINIKEGVALCPGCGTLSRLSELNFSDRSIQDIISNPPKGCSVEAAGEGVVATASLRSIPGFIFTAGFALFWNGIVSLFVLLAIAGLYTNLVGPLPEWFPAPGLNEGRPEMNGKPMGLGEAGFLCVFLILFVTVGCGMTAAAIINLIGKVEVVMDEQASWVATGVWLFKWKRTFDPLKVLTVTYGTTAWQSDGAKNRLIELVADRTIKFGSLLQSDRMEWLKVVLAQLLVHDQANFKQPKIPRLQSNLPRLTWITQRH